MNLTEQGFRIVVASIASTFIGTMIVSLFPAFIPGILQFQMFIYLASWAIAMYLLVVRELPLRDLLAFTIAMFPFTLLGFELLKRGFISPWEGLYEVYLYRTLLALGAISGAYLLTIRFRLFDRIVQR